MDLNPSSMSESLAISFYSNERFYDHYFSYSLRLILPEIGLFSTHLAILLLF